MSNHTREPLNLPGPLVPVPKRSRRGWTDEDTHDANEAAAKLPERLYRYVPLRDVDGKPSKEQRRRLRTVVVASNLHFSSYLAFNDPFDCRFRLSFEGDEETIRAHWEEAGAELGVPKDQVKRTVQAMLNMTPDMEREFARKQREHLATYGICCFMSRPDDLLAWAHYARGHTGVCFRFDPHVLFQSIAQAPSMLLPVQYSADHPVVPIYRPRMWRGTLLMLATKGLEWNYEQEWRIVREMTGSVKFPPEALDAVILGARIPKGDEEYVRSVVPDSARVFRAGLLDDEYGLGIA